MSAEEPLIIHVRLFAVLRERMGADRVELRLEAPATVADAMGALSGLEPLGELLRSMPVRMALNRDYAAPQSPLAPGDELALIPPLSGGEGSALGSSQDTGEDRLAEARVHVSISSEPISAEELCGRVADPRAGAIVLFQGVTRELERLDYEAYTAMARERIERILRECVCEHGLCAAAAEHRVGRVALGEPSVIVAVSAPHRGEAFEGAREAIDRVKAEAPIWKREHASGALPRWAPGTEPPL